MQKVPNHPRLFKRGDVYYYRAAIPSDIRDTYPKAEEKFSLQTTNQQDAIRLVRKHDAEVEQRFDDYRAQCRRNAEPPVTTVTPAQLKLIEQTYFTYLLDEDEERRLDGFFSSGKGSFEEYANDAQEKADYAGFHLARGLDDVWTQSEAREVLTWTNVGINLHPDSPDWRRVYQAIRKAEIRGADAIKQRNAGQVIDTPNWPSETPETENDGYPTTGAPKLTGAVAKWISEKRRSSWSEKTASDHEVWSGHMIALAGDKPLDRYTKADARAFKDALSALPANWSRHPRLKNRPFKKAVETAKQIGLEPMTVSNINKIIGFMSGFWNWAEQNYDEVASNPFKGLKLNPPKRPEEQRDPFTFEELNRLFRAPPYDKGDPLGSGALFEDAYWIPLIGLFTGARSGEILQLTLDDIQQIDGIDTLNINAIEFTASHEAGVAVKKHVKTESSHRVIPLHAMLMRLGFRSLLAQRAKAGEHQLFPSIKPAAHDGYRSSTYQRVFKKQREAAGICRPRVSFHSLRHNFIDACRRCGVPGEIREALSGHAERGMGARYGGLDRYGIHRLSAELQKLTYDSVDLSHLYVDAGRL